MRSFELVAASVMLAAGVWVVNSGGSPATEIDTMTTSSVTTGGQAYLIRSHDTATACQIEKGETVAKDLSPVTIQSGCESVLPGMARIRFWRDRDDGSVELVGEGRETVIVFGAGDGVEYESYRPVSPVLTLSSRG